MTTRRDALITLATAAAVPAALDAQHTHADSPSAPPPAIPRTLDDPAFRTLEAACERILPRTDTPGAKDAGVAIIIDENAGRNARRKEEIIAALAALDAQSKQLHSTPFAAASAEQQDAALSSILDSAHFRLLKNLTTDAYYSTREGLVQELGYHGNTYLAAFPGCTHPEHQS